MMKNGYDMKNEEDSECELSLLSKVKDKDTVQVQH